MEYTDNAASGTQTTSRILCCECGVVIVPNPINMCVGCIRSHVDITKGIPKHATLYFCGGCQRYLQPPAEWVSCSLESPELLTLCLKKLKGLNKVKLVDASFIWTEPHSKRIKLKLTVHGTVYELVTLQQVFVVDYIVANQMCDDCHKTEAQNFWRASVQVRQKAENKKTFYYLEQLVLKYKAHENTLGITPCRDGIDFFFATESHARKLVDFLTAMVPCQYQHSKKIISHDIHSNIYNYKFTFSVEIVPVSKDSVVCLPKKLTQQLGGISPICLVHKVTSSVHLIDPSTTQVAELNATTYWRNQFNSICNPKQLVEYVVQELEIISERNRKVFPGQGAISQRHVLCDVYVVKASELGINENLIHTRSHLGHVLKVGDTVLGYNLEDSNVNDDNLDKLDRDKVPNVILVKKYYDRSSRRRQRIWKLKHLADHDAAFNAPDEHDYNEFLDDLEEDPTLRQNVNIFKDPTKQVPVDLNDDTGDENAPRITLEEMLNDLMIDDVEMQE